MLKRRINCFWQTMAVVAAFCNTASAIDRVVFERKGATQTIRGRLLAAAVDGGLLLISREGVLWAFEPREIREHTQDAEPFQAFSPAEMEQALRQELDAGFDIHTTAHYVICHNTSRAYARWCGTLLERLYGAFINYWKRRGFPVSSPELPLPVVVFADEASYHNYARGELGNAARTVIGYYSLRTNRVVMYDLTGVQQLRQSGDRRGTFDEINVMLARPQAVPLVATIVHEATHQIAFNCGLLTRYSDTPLWISEGIAIYFETPDLTSSTGWRGIGEINRPRLETLRKNLSRRPPNALAEMIASDERLRSVRTATDAYAESWAVNYFLIRQYPKQYLRYIKLLSEKPPLVSDDPATKLSEFKQCFGDDLQEMDRRFVQYMQRLR
jgi:hypothetical protein